MAYPSNEELQLLSAVLPKISAQMRAPLGNLYAALSRIATPEQRDADAELDYQAALLLQSYFRLLRLAGNLNDAATLMSNEPLPMQIMDLAELGEEMYHQCRHLAEFAEVTLEFQPLTRPLLSAANAAGVQRVLYHLLSNAIKASPKGSCVTLQCGTSAQNILFTVRDHGCGIGNDPLAQLYEMMQQDTLPSPGGLGLGLSLAQKSAQAMGGQLLIESLCDGTVATFTIPIRKVGTSLHHPPVSYAGGFPQALIELSDALPLRAFMQNPPPVEKGTP